MRSDGKWRGEIVKSIKLSVLSMKVSLIPRNLSLKLYPSKCWLNLLFAYTTRLSN